MEQTCGDILAFLHISSMGQMDEEIGESTYIILDDVNRAAQVCRDHPEWIIGIKVGLARDKVGSNGLVALDLAQSAAQKAGGVTVKLIPVNGI